MTVTLHYNRGAPNREQGLLFFSLMETANFKHHLDHKQTKIVVTLTRVLNVKLCL